MNLSVMQVLFGYCYKALKQMYKRLCILWHRFNIVMIQQILLLELCIDNMSKQCLEVKSFSYDLYLVFSQNLAIIIVNSALRIQFTWEKQVSV